MLLITGRASSTAEEEGGGSEPGEWIGKTAIHVLQGGAGSGNGSNWSNAASNIPSSIARDTVVYLGDGSYGNQTLDDAASSSLKIYIVKATEDDHGSDVGWNSNFGDGQAVLGTLFIETPRWHISGQRRTETTRMEQPAGYGIFITEARATSLDGDDASNSVFEYCEFGGAWSEAAWSEAVCSLNTQCLYFVFNQTDVTFNRCCFHNSGHNGALAMLHGSDGFTFDHCDFYFGWGKEAIAAPNSGLNNLTVRYCRFWNGTQHDLCEDVEGGGTTAEIGAFGNDLIIDGCEVYGCIFYTTISTAFNAWIAFAGLGASNTSATNCKVHHCTFAGISEDSVFGEVHLFGGSGNEAKNNLFYDIVGTASLVANSVSNNVTEASDPFVDYANRDFRLAESIGGGTDLGSPYNVDFAGNPRGSSPDVGAYAST